ncbi:MAG TPA: glycosyl hydrolase [Burkholderiales bacterium]|nr:glycosyl hydrolase [Burkholderiales bacterium]
MRRAPAGRLLLARLRAAALLAALLALPAATAAGREILHHVHGLAFAPDGKALLVPAHTGLAVYRDGRWSLAPGPAHDFMGFSVAKDAIYTSGHPAPGAPLRNPLGLMKSSDGGRTWRQLGLAGEADFHLLAAGYRTNVVYVVNEEPNSRMRSSGLHYSTDDGKSWKRSAASGLGGQVISIAAHPTEAGTILLGTLGGLYLSRDFGASFRRIGLAPRATAVLFDLDGRHLYFATDGTEALLRVSLDGRLDASLALPKLEKDFVTYIAQNPVKPAELAIATRRRSVFLSPDAGKSWKQIAREGEGL